MEWTPNLSVGNNKIDQQHQDLLLNIDKIKELDTSNINKKEADALLNFITDYMTKHFNEEEVLLKKNNYPDLEKHHEIHEKFKKDMNTAIENAKLQNYSKVSLSSVKVKLSSWLISHIMKEDRKYSKYL